jgi:hypothetical protein
MGKVIAQASMSLDGFIADARDQVGPLFDWYSKDRLRSPAATLTSSFIPPRRAPNISVLPGRRSAPT